MKIPFMAAVYGVVFLKELFSPSNELAEAPEAAPRATTAGRAFQEAMRTASMLQGVSERLKEEGAQGVDQMIAGGSLPTALGMLEDIASGNEPRSVSPYGAWGPDAARVPRHPH